MKSQKKKRGERMSWLVGLVPLATGFVMGRICPARERALASPPPAQPPSAVFGIVWPLLYLALGVAWVRARERTSADVWFVLIVGSLLLWQYLWGCRGDEKLALYSLIASIALVLATALWINQADRTASVLLAPLLAWLILASMLNYSIVDRSASARAADK